MGDRFLKEGTPTGLVPRPITSSGKEVGRNPPGGEGIPPTGARPGASGRRQPGGGASGGRQRAGAPPSPAGGRPPFAQRSPLFLRQVARTEFRLEEVVEAVLV